LTFKALGRNHITSTPNDGHRDALFNLNSRIPLVAPVQSCLYDASWSASQGHAWLRQFTIRGRHRSRLTSPRSRVCPVRYSPDTPASYLSLTSPGPWANPFPEVTDVICRLLLPTLFYRLEAIHLETCCGYGYDLARNLHHLPRIFTGRRELTGHRKRRDALWDPGPYLPSNRFQGRQPLPRKENSSRDSHQMFRRRHKLLE